MKLYKIFMFISLAGLLFSCEKPNTKKEEVSKGIKTPDISFCKVEYGSYQIKTPIYGEVQNQAATYISSPIGGILKALYVKNGDMVKKGEVIAVIDTKVYQDKAMAIAQDIESLKRKLKYYESRYERAKKLYQLGSMSYQEYSQIKTDLALARGELNKNIYLEKSIKDEASYGVIKAPFDGIVSNVIPKGTNVNPGSPIAFISAKKLYGEFFIPFNMKLTKDDKIMFENKLYPIHAFQDDKSRLAVIIPISSYENPGNSLKAFIIKTIQGQKVPSKALVLYNNRPSVFIKEGDVLKNIPVKILGNLGNYYVVSGISADSVVCKGAKLLKDGEKIK